MSLFHLLFLNITYWPMHRSIAGYNPYNLFIITIDYSKNFTTRWLLTIGHMSMFVVKSIVIQIISLGYGSINWGTKHCLGLLKVLNSCRNNVQAKLE